MLICYDRKDSIKIIPTIYPCHHFLFSSFEHLSGDIIKLIYSPNGRYLLSASDDGSLIVWNAETLTSLSVMRNPLSSAGVFTCGFSLDSQYIFSCTIDGYFGAWSLLNYQYMPPIIPQHNFQTCAYSLRTQHVLFVDPEGCFERCNAISVYPIVYPIKERSQTLINTAKHLTYSPNCSRILCVSSHLNQEVVHVLNANSKLECLATLIAQPFKAFANPNPAKITMSSYSYNYIFIGYEDGTVSIWNAHTYQRVRILKHSTTSITHCAYSPNERYVAISASDSIQIWCLSTFKCIAILKSKYTIHHCAYSPNGRFIVSGSSNGKIELWNTEDLGI